MRIPTETASHVIQPAQHALVDQRINVPHAIQHCLENPTQQRTLRFHVDAYRTTTKMLEESALFVIRHAPSAWIAHYLTVIHAIAQLLELLSMGFQANVSA